MTDKPTDSPIQETAGAPSDAEFPVATLQRRASRWKNLFGGSRMWWATLACLVVAGILTWQSIEKTGPVIIIGFPEGHGLQVGDFVRHRGIDVGHVDRVDLRPDLSGIRVEVTLLPGAEPLAQEETQFWIVHPQLS
ncbi:MAG: MlaD family protein, partial [Aeoliella sp.]